MSSAAQLLAAETRNTSDGESTAWVTMGLSVSYPDRQPLTELQD